MPYVRWGHRPRTVQYSTVQYSTVQYSWGGWILTGAQTASLELCDAGFRLAQRSVLLSSGSDARLPLVIRPLLILAGAVVGALSLSGRWRYTQLTGWVRVLCLSCTPAKRPGQGPLTR